MKNTTQDKLISIKETEFQAIAQYFMTGNRPTDVIGTVTFMEAESAVTAIAERVINDVMLENDVTLSMEPVPAPVKLPANAIELPTAKKW